MTICHATKSLALPTPVFCQIQNVIDCYFQSDWHFNEQLVWNSAFLFDTTYIDLNLNLKLSQCTIDIFLTFNTVVIDEEIIFTMSNCQKYTSTLFTKKVMLLRKKMSQNTTVSTQLKYIHLKTSQNGLGVLEAYLTQTKYKFHRHLRLNEAQPQNNQNITWKGKWMWCQSKYKHHWRRKKVICTNHYLWKGPVWLGL